MFISRKIRLIPTPEQEVQFWKSAGVARWAYNYFLAENDRIYQEYLANGEQGQSRAYEGEIRKYINNVLKKTTHTWLKEVSSNVMKQAVKDADKALRRFFDKLSKKPKFKTKRKSKPSFYVNYESLHRKNGGFQGEKLGFVRTSEPLPKLLKGQKYCDPHITFDGLYWNLSIVYEIPEEKCELTGESLGIDVGIKDLAICSDGKVYKNINKTKEVRRLKKKLIREQRKLSRMINANILRWETMGGKRRPIYRKPLKECKNIQKQNIKIRKIYRRLTNIRDNYLHQVTTEIAKTKPSRIVIETLNVKGMMKNKHLSKAIDEQKFFTFKEFMRYKCQRCGIEFVEAPQLFPSSKTCSCCGHVKKDLKLSDRVYKCEVCGLIIDRDLNASINLANYQSA